MRYRGEMYLISARSDFWSSRGLSATDEVRFVDKTHHLVDCRVTLNDLQAVVAGQRVLLLVHGYDSSSLSTLFVYRQMRASIETQAAVHGATYDLVVGYLWPGEWLPTEFPAAVATAEALADRTRQRLLDLQGAASIDVCAHSLGNLVVLGALTTGGVKLRNMFALAPAIEHDALDLHGNLYAASAHCEQLHVLHSRHDWVLSRGYQHYKATPALGLQGPLLPASTAATVFVVDSQWLVTGYGFGTAHNQYRMLAETYELMARAAVSRPQTKHFRLDRLDDAGWS